MTPWSCLSLCPFSWAFCLSSPPCRLLTRLRHSLVAVSRSPNRGRKTRPPTADIRVHLLCHCWKRNGRNKANYDLILSSLCHFDWGWVVAQGAAPGNCVMSRLNITNVSSNRSSCRSRSKKKKKSLFSTPHTSRLSLRTIFQRRRIIEPLLDAEIGWIIYTAYSPLEIKTRQATLWHCSTDSTVSNDVHYVTKKNTVLIWRCSEADEWTDASKDTYEALWDYFLSLAVAAITLPSCCAFHFKVPRVFKEINIHVCSLALQQLLT